MGVGPKEIIFQRYSHVQKLQINNQNLNFQQRKVTKHTKKQENIVHSEELSKFTEIIPKKAKTSYLLDKDLKQLF